MRRQRQFAMPAGRTLSSPGVNPQAQKGYWGMPRMGCYNPVIEPANNRIIEGFVNIGWTIVFVDFAKRAKTSAGRRNERTHSSNHRAGYTDCVFGAGVIQTAALGPAMAVAARYRLIGRRRLVSLA